MSKLTAFCGLSEIVKFKDKELTVHTAPARYESLWKGLRKEDTKEDTMHKLVKICLKDDTITRAEWDELPVGFRNQIMNAMAIVNGFGEVMDEAQRRLAAAEGSEANKSESG